MPAKKRIDADGGLSPEKAEQLRSEARAEYGSEEVQIDPHAPVSVGDEGAFVQAWVWVPFEHEDEGKKEAARPWGHD